MSPTLYMIPGLGADSRMYGPLIDAGLRCTVLEFIPPMPGESLREYSLRMAAGIDHSQPFWLGGTSLGGIIATEIARVHPPEKLLLISTCKHSGEFPFHLKLFRYLPVQRLVSGEFLIRFGPRASFLPSEHEKLLRQMRDEADPTFVKWAVNAVVCWKSPHRPPQVPTLHVHGTRDLLLPGMFTRNAVRIPGGKHVMVVQRAPDLFTHIRKFLSTPEPVTA